MGRQIPIRERSETSREIHQLGHECLACALWLEQVWVELQARLCSPASATGTGTAPEALQRLECLLRKSSEDAAEDAGNCEGEQVSPRGLDGSARVDVLCTGSLYAIAEILQLFGAKVV